MKTLYQYFGAALLALYVLVEAAGYELPGNSTRGVVPAGARNAGGYRSFHFWSGGK